MNLKKANQFGVFPMEIEFLYPKIFLREIEISNHS